MPGPPPDDKPEQPSLSACDIQLAGLVQGLGIRPTIARLARDLDLAGHVRNRLDGVEIHLEGRAEQIEGFRRQLAARFPTEASLATLQTEPSSMSGATRFEIITAEGSGMPATRVAPDLVVCHDCLDEISNPDDRRHAYAFTSCTRCGPRFSMIERMPYERRDTAMRAFRMCPDCQREYTSVDDRRYHAQTNACPECGPQPWLADQQGRQLEHGAAAITAAARALRQGRILALRGIGGYQLLVDACDESAVLRLRQRKQRPAKPLAVMTPTLETAKQLAHIDETAESSLCSAANPIVLVPARTDAHLAPSIHPGFVDVGLMLPSSPLHWLLLQHFPGAVVATSGNVEGDPLVVDPAAAAARLAQVADLFLHHDRPVVHGIDDSVVRPIGGGITTIRLARGLAPRPLALDIAEPTLATGAHQKNAIAIANGAQAVLGPHIGDLETLPTRARWAEHVDAMQTLFGSQPRCIVHDAHPGYFTTQWAQDEHHRAQDEHQRHATGASAQRQTAEPRELRSPRIAVQHHFAHVLATMLEHRWLDREVLGVAFDGTGFGTDETIWGGEFLRARRGGFERVGHLRPFRLPMGESAVRQPWRLAASLTAEVEGPVFAQQRPWPGVSPHDLRTVMKLANSPAFSPVTTSAGRLFDAVAAIVLNLAEAQFEGQPAMLLEAVCDRHAAGEYEMPMDESRSFQMDWKPALRAIMQDTRTGTPPGTIATRFHRGVARSIVNAISRFPDLPVVLTGGVFQNRVLTELILELHNNSQPIALARSIPPNDGGIAAGQMVFAMQVRHGRAS